MAATNDLLTAAEAAEALNLPAGSVIGDGERERMVTAVSTRIDELCGPVVQITVSNELHDGGCTRIFPRFVPISSVTTLVEYSGTASTTLTAETNSTKPAAGYLIDGPRSGRDVWIRRRSGNADSWFADGRRNIDLTYVAGRAADTASVSALFKTACATILRRLHQREAGGWAIPVDDPYAYGGVGFFKVVDPMVNELLSDELLPPAAG